MNNNFQPVAFEKKRLVRATIISLIITPIITLVVCCCIPMGVYEVLYSLSTTSCRPITYPDGVTITKPYTERIDTTSDDIETVLQFFDQHLNAVDPSVAVTNQWRRIKTSETSYLYACVASSDFVYENGCINIASDDRANASK